MNVIDWLVDSDPSIRWQVTRDLTHGPADVVASERSRVATEGWGARLLALQAPDGRWAGRPWSQEWTDTFHVLELLRRFGLDPDSEQASHAVGLIRENVVWRGGAPGEMRALYIALRDTTLPAHDVHGRATIVQLTWDEIERRFGRR